MKSYSSLWTISAFAVFLFLGQAKIVMAEDLIVCADYLPCHPQTGELLVPEPRNEADLNCYFLYRSWCENYRKELRTKEASTGAICEEKSKKLKKRIRRLKRRLR